MEFGDELIIKIRAVQSMMVKNENGGTGKYLLSIDRDFIFSIGFWYGRASNSYDLEMAMSDVAISQSLSRFLAIRRITKK